MTSRSCSPMISGSEPSRGSGFPSCEAMDPNYFSIQASVCSGSMSPTMDNTALFGA